MFYVVIRITDEKNFKKEFNMKILLVFNPAAGNGKANKLISKIKQEFNERKISFELLTTSSPGHAVDLVKDADLSGYDGIISAGGDGTMFESLNGYYLNPGKVKPPFGILPIGTGNAFVKDIGLKSGDWKSAINMIADNKVRKVDVAKFKTEGNVYYYLNIIGLGFVADVNKLAQKLKFFGNLSYTIGVLDKIIFLRNYKVFIEIDGKKIERENVFIEVSNTRYTSNFLMAPTAEVDDGYLDVTLLNKTSRRRMLQCLPKIFTGEHVTMEEVETFKAKKISIQTDLPKELTPDGEMFGTTPLEIECLHRDLEVFGN